MTGHSLDVGLIPRRTSDGCPNNMGHRTFEYHIDFPPVDTCACEDHCSWDMCFLLHPPEECLCGTESKWYWDARLNAWVAQVVQGNKLTSRSDRVQRCYIISY